MVSEYGLLFGGNLVSAGPKLVLFCYIPSRSLFCALSRSGSLLLQEKKQTFADLTNYILLQWCTVCADNWSRIINIVGDILLFRRFAFLREKCQQMLVSKKGGRERERDWQSLVCSASVWVSDNAVRVLLGDGQIKNSRTTCGKTDTSLKASIHPWVMFHGAAVSGWTLISSRCPRSKTTSLPAPPQNKNTPNLYGVIDLQVYLVVLHLCIYLCILSVWFLLASLSNLDQNCTSFHSSALPVRLPVPVGWEEQGKYMHNPPLTCRLVWCGILKQMPRLSDIIGGY